MMHSDRPLKKLRTDESLSLSPTSTGLSTSTSYGGGGGGYQQDGYDDIDTRPTSPMDPDEYGDITDDDDEDDDGKKKSKSGKGGSSCHQCKSRRNFAALTYCTSNLDKKNKKCRKKFCGHCLKKFYREPPAAIADRGAWKCPSCRKICCCAACRRRKQKGHGGGGGGGGGHSPISPTNFSPAHAHSHSHHAHAHHSHHDPTPALRQHSRRPTASKHPYQVALAAQHAAHEQSQQQQHQLHPPHHPYQAPPPPHHPYPHPHPHPHPDDPNAYPHPHPHPHPHDPSQPHPEYQPDPNHPNESDAYDSQQESAADEDGSDGDQEHVPSSQFPQRLSQHLEKMAQASRADPSTEFARLWREAQAPKLKRKIQSILTKPDLKKAQKIEQIAQLLRSS